MKRSWCFLMLLLCLTYGCLSTNKTSAKITQLTETPFQNSCHIHGTLLSPGGQPVSNEVVWLGTVVYDNNKKEGYFIIDGSRSPSALSDEQGVFIFTDININDYVVIIGNLEMNPYILPKSSNVDEAEIITCVDGTIVDVGVIQLDK